MQHAKGITEIANPGIQRINMKIKITPKHKYVKGNRYPELYGVSQRWLSVPTDHLWVWQRIALEAAMISFSLSFAVLRNIQITVES